MNQTNENIMDMYFPGIKGFIKLQKNTVIKTKLNK